MISNLRRNFGKSEPPSSTAGRRGIILLQIRTLLVALAIAMTLFASGQKAGAAWPLAEWPSKKEPHLQEKSQEKSAVVLSEAENFQHMIAYLAARLGDNLEASNTVAGLLEDGIVVCSFVELKKLNRTSSFGRYIADQLINELQQRQYRVLELRKSRNIYVQAGRGEFGLSRDPAKIEGEAEAGAMLTGTYTLTPDGVLVNARIVDNRENTVLASASAAMPRTVLVSQLLADSATAKTKREREYIYMKELQP